VPGSRENPRPVYESLGQIPPSNSASRLCTEPRIPSDERRPDVDPNAKKDIDVDSVLKKQFPDATSRAKVKAAFTRYCNHEGASAKPDVEGDKRGVWTDGFMAAVAPWAWWQLQGNA